jgi:hypothetical protein
MAEAETTAMAAATQARRNLVMELQILVMGT